NASGVITEFATGYPGYNSLVPKSSGSVGEVLKENGFNTSWFGKMHNVPDWMSSQAGPFDLWPSGLARLALLWQIYSRRRLLQIHFRQCGHRCGGSRAKSSRMAWRTAGKVG